MNMKASIFSAAPVALVFAGMLPAADPQLLNLVMPDAKMMAGVNVDQAKTSPFGQYVLVQVQAQNQNLQQLATLTGFDPTRDLNELLIASNGAQPRAANLVLARGTFDAAKIQAAAVGGAATTQSYAGATLVLDPKGNNAVAFLNGVIAVAGDVASVKAALDRQTAPSSPDAALLVQVSQLSATEDAWAVSEIPPPAHVGVPANTGGTPTIPLTAFQKITQGSGGVKFGAQIAITANAQTATPDDATALAGILQFLANLGQMQGQQNPQAAAILKSLVVTSNGNVVNISLSIPEAQAEAALQLKPNATVSPNGRRPGRRL
ncbi:MAG TPA: hypothetical protein VG096_05845 [Bryobacteraceae bacterium]|jgi:hypothetical protein|nr:hypothetical protein [Bryobacteraceae bacterium]